MRSFLALGGLIVLAGAAQASTSYYSASGTVAGEPANAAAAFTISGNTLTIELWNTGGAGNVQDVSSELVGVSFEFTDGSNVVFNAASLAGSAPLGGVNCTSGTCIAQVAPASPFSWTFTGTSTFCLYAGNCGEGKPNAIVNSNVAVAGAVSNVNHNPLLLSSTTDAGTGVTFTITFTDTVAPTTVGDVSFGFGTAGGTVTGDPTTAPTPEPISAVLTGTGLLGLIAFKARRARRAA